MEFANPEFFWLLLLIPALIAWYWLRHKSRHAEIQLSTTSVFEKNRKSLRQYLIHLLFVLRMLALALLIIALARPQSSSSKKNVSVEGIDIVMALDISSSMLARDLKPDRLEAAKSVAQDFINGRPNDRVSLVVFSKETFTQVPLTTDHSVLSNIFKDIKSGILEDGTAIGDGLATAVNRLKESKAVSKVIILLTDGENNAGALDPKSAAEIAEMYGIRIYTIGVGSRGTAPYPVSTAFGTHMQQIEVKIDEELLKEIAAMTDGRYFRATSNQKLEDIYDEIDKLEKSKIDVTEFTRKHEEFLLLALIALGLFVVEFLLRNTVFKTLP
ncbi:MAG: VWA domain-containing protein [Bacteroidales bacterium]|nr:VWA domain-containing protein [Bacteroidales bacterium]MCF8387749.1 VWA domain-containing protein [Bacteroidales bacterium]MCF8398313.1 VWA domain-containing protein [Bacteroidales bacterium]